MEHQKDGIKQQITKHGQIGRLPLIEGAVAGFFNDLVDGVSDPNGPSNETGNDDDSVTWPASYLGQVIRDCSVNWVVTPSSGTYTQLDGINQWVYCAERSLAAQSLIDPVSGTAYFAQGALNYNGFAETASEPSCCPGHNLTTVRGLWLWNLYNQ